MRILVSGGVGAWGQAFTKLLKDKHHKVVVVDRNEKAIADFKKKFPDVEVHMMDFVNWNFDKKGFDLLIHLAAYKHIDLSEVNVSSCIRNNLTKTVALYKSAKRNNVKILFCSTDKSVEPVSVYGMSKTIGERLTWEYGGQVIRSGNIYGSTGSVINTWKEAIKNQEPLTVTDFKMERFFIPVDEAVSKAWDGFTKGDKLIIVDIGGHQKLGHIVDNLLAEQGFTRDTYKPGIKIIGLRAGERLKDKIKWDTE